MRTILTIFAIYIMTEAIVGLFLPHHVFGDELLLLLEYHQSKLRFFIHNTVNSLVFGVFVITTLFTPESYIEQYDLYYVFALVMLAVSFGACNLMNTGQLTRPSRRRKK